MKYRVCGADCEPQDEPIRGAINTVYNEDGTLFGHMWVPTEEPRGFHVTGTIVGPDDFGPLPFKKVIQVAGFPPCTCLVAAMDPARPFRKCRRHP